jgi:peptidoglycan hydrolase-like protein with peptidoglycan-binding domain
MPSTGHGPGEAASWQAGPSSDALRRGDRGRAVVEIRAALSALGLLGDADEGFTTGKQVALDAFDDELDHAVRAFQQRRGLIVDGVVGGATEFDGFIKQRPTLRVDKREVIADQCHSARYANSMRPGAHLLSGEFSRGVAKHQAVGIVQP